MLLFYVSGIKGDTIMGGNYEKSIYNQLMDVMARLDSMEKELHTEKIEHKEDVARLNKKIDHLTHENHILKEENARLKSILNHDSSNTSLPPSSDKAGSRAVNTYNGREKSSRKAGAQKGHKGTTPDQGRDRRKDPHREIQA
jgi:transposase